jgi:hypothetical protein
MFEFAGKYALVDEFQPAVFPFDRADFVVKDGIGWGARHGGQSITYAPDPRPDTLRGCPRRREV